MKAKLFVFLLCLGLIAAAMGPDRVEASCSGDNCGCGEVYFDCIQHCGPNETPIQCDIRCTRLQTQCAVACCSW